ncbi:MAG: Grx4 family monothiol glutaredoxin [Gammaproteobacteria bacterium]
MHFQDTESRIQSQLEKNPVLLYMKGSPDFPMCGFSAKVANILNLLEVKYAYVNILENQDIRSTLPTYAKWPTFPQLYIQGELIGGCDIVSDLFMNQKEKLKGMFARVPGVFLEAGSQEEAYRLAIE